MKYNLRSIRQDAVINGKMLIYWLGGYGFAVKFDNGRIVCLDPYLSDCVERIAGFRRLSLPPIEANELQADIYLITHDHPDHLDEDSLKTILNSNPGINVIVGKSCTKVVEKEAKVFTVLGAGETTQADELTITAVPADHGELCPDAIGFIIKYKGRGLYFTGDTSLNYSMLKPAIQSRPEIIVPCINPAFGNLGEKGAAELSARCESKLAVPAHFGLFAEHGGDAELFREELRKIAPNCQTLLLTPGRGEAI